MSVLKETATIAGRTLRSLFEGPWFAVFMLCVLVVWNAMLVAMMLMPDAQGALGEFTADFKRRCFDYDSVTGSVKWASVVPYVTAPLILGTATFLVYRRQLGVALRKPMALSICVGAALGVVAFGAFGLMSMADAAKGDEPLAAGESLPFPADKLRTQLKAPEFRLTNQHGVQVSPQDYRGSVVMITAIYATCSDACPMILTQAKSAMAALTEHEQAQVHIFAVTLDPERDDQAALAGMARGHRVKAPQWNLVTGKPAEVNAVIEFMGIWRKWNAEKGRLDHSNAFLLIDRQGRLAYRFSLGDLQQQWLTEALKLLANEPEPKP
ncbi:MAG: SCO family protein [Planctomycetes bacterium]|nr:SCO family protein [Planctomycetota bacterium]